MLKGLLEDLGAQGKLLEHTRKVFRGQQSWVLHMAPSAKPREDTLHVSFAGKDYFITLTPMASRLPRQTTVKEFARPPRRRSPPMSYAEAVGSFPPLPKREVPRTRSDTQETPQNPIAHIQKLEELVRSLVGVLASQSIPLGRHAETLLHGFPLKTARGPPSDSLSDGADSLDQYMGDEPADDNVHYPARLEDDSFVEEAPKRPRTRPGPSDGMEWAHAEHGPFQHIVWGRVAGDGNCFWRSIAQLLQKDWQQVKKEVLHGAPALAAVWAAYFSTTSEDFLQHAKHLGEKDVWGSEIAAALVAARYKKPVLIVTPGVIWRVTVGDCDLKAPLVIRLAAKHYDPIKQTLSPALLAAVAAAVPADTSHLQLEGGAKLTSTLATWNLSAFDAHHMEAVGLDADVTLLQETSCSARAQGIIKTHTSHLTPFFRPNLPSRKYEKITPGFDCFFRSSNITLQSIPQNLCLYCS